MLILLTSIQLDIVEMVIAISKDYDLFQELKKLLPKLNNEDKVARMNDKLCCMTLKEDVINYELNGLIHREYDKPSTIYMNDVFFCWSLNGRNKRLYDLPFMITYNTDRKWIDEFGFSHRENDVPGEIWNDGTQVWYVKDIMSRKTIKKFIIFPDGNIQNLCNDGWIISIRESVFDYI